MARRRRTVNTSPNTHERKSYRLEIIAVIVTAVIGIGAIWISQRGIDKTVEIAQQSGAFDKADNYLGIGSLDLPPSQEDTIQVVYGGTFDMKSVDISYLPISVGNFGKKNADDIQLIIDYPKKLGLAFTDTSILKANSLPGAATKREIMNNDETTESVVYSLNHLNPGVRITLEDPFFLKKTDMEIDVKSADSVPLKFRAYYSYTFAVTLLGKDLRTQRRVFSFSCYEAANIDQLIDSYVSKLKRTKAENSYYYFIYPKKEKIHSKGDQSIHEYSVGSNNIFFGAIQNLSPETDIALGVYGADQKLIKVKAYDWDNKWKFDIPATQK